MKVVFHGLSTTPRDTVAIRPLKKSVNKATATMTTNGTPSSQEKASSA
jgi:hypothetical protein